jgi:hypothetical protein
MRITIEVPGYSPTTTSPSVSTEPGAATSVAWETLAGGAAPTLSGGGIALATQLEALSAGAAEQSSEGAAMNGAVDALDGGAAPR